MIVSWNLTSRRARLNKADVIVISPVKSGRTWLRVMLNKYFSLHYGVAFSLQNLHEQNPDIPSIQYDHWLSLHFRSASWLERLLGRHIIPDAILRRKKVILLLRDPRDAIVSSFYQVSKRRHGKRKVSMTLSDYIRSPRLGIGKLVQILNLVHDKLQNHPQCILIRYETLRTNTNEELQRMLHFLGITQPDPQFVSEAISFANFQNMKRMEQNNEISGRVLRAGDPNDPNSFKVRKGIIGGYLSEFSDADLAYIEEQLALLHPYFGYTATSQTVKNVIAR
jgi:hypothetical protein